jgi:hypothetical protein
MFTQIFSHPQIQGLILDIIGAFYIAKSFIFKTSKDLAAESYGTNYPDKDLTGGISGNLFRSFYKQAIEAKTGFVIIAMGFAGQIVGIVCPNFVMKSWLGLCIILSALLIPQILFKFLFRQVRLDEIEQKAENELSKKYEQ